MFYIYDRASSRIKSNPAKGKSYLNAEYKTMAAAKAALTRMDKKWFDKKCNASDFDKKYHPERFEDKARPIFTCAIAEADYYHKNIEKFEITYSMYDKEKKHPIRQSVNTPAYMDPGCESYWSM